MKVEQCVARALVSRFMAGESAERLAADFDLTLGSVEAALRWAIRRYRGACPTLEYTYRPGCLRC